MRQPLPDLAAARGRRLAAQFARGRQASRFYLHVAAGGGSFRERIMRARLERLLSSDIASKYYQEMFTGLGQSHPFLFPLPR